MDKYKNKIILITGSGSGIGKLLAHYFSAEGGRAVLWDINIDGAKKVADDIKKSGGEARAYKCDVSDRNSVYKTALTVKKEVGKVDVLVNNAGIVSGKSFLKCTDEELRKTIDVNLMAHFWTVKAFLPDMIKANSGHIVTISSAAGLIGVSSLADYCASKFASFGFNESLRMELRKQKLKGIKTTCICPFFISTGLFEGVKTRFKFLLPIFEEKKAALKIFKAIRRERPILKIPWLVNTIPVFRLLPVRFMDFVADFLGVSSAMDNFTGRTHLKTRRKK